MVWKTLPRMKSLPSSLPSRRSSFITSWLICIWRASWVLKPRLTLLTHKGRYKSKQSKDYFAVQYTFCPPSVGKIGHNLQEHILVNLVGSPPPQLWSLIKIKFLVGNHFRRLLNQIEMFKQMSMRAKSPGKGKSPERPAGGDQITYELFYKPEQAKFANTARVGLL